MWETVAKFVSEHYNVKYELSKLKDKYFICPSCLEGLTEIDWKYNEELLIGICPLCKFDFYTQEIIEEEN